MLARSNQNNQITNWKSCKLLSATCIPIRGIYLYIYVYSIVHVYEYAYAYCTLRFYKFYKNLNTKKILVENFTKINIIKKKHKQTTIIK